MLDLDALARQRAEALKQHYEVWKKAIWCPEFQKISANMSDGEVLSLLELCPSARDFEIVSHYLERRSVEIGLTPYSVLEQEAENEGITLEAWVKARAEKA